MPVKFGIDTRFVPRNDKNSNVIENKPTRHLLDTEIIHITTPNIQESKNMDFFIDITIVPINQVLWSQFISDSSKSDTIISFTIEIESLIFGILPYSMIPTVVIIVVILIIIVASLAPCAFQIINKKKID